MSNILLKMVSLLIPAIVGYALKKCGVFKDKDYLVMSKAMTNVTMPAAVISSFSTFQMDVSMLGVTLVAFLTNIAVLAFAWLATASLKQDRTERRLQMMMITGFNMGNFVIPFVQEFMGLSGLAITSLFDSGNTVMCLGGSYIVIATLLNSSGKRMTGKDVLKKLFSTAVLPTYLVMVILSLCGVRVPEVVVSILSPMANANAFAAMFMLGLMMEIRFDGRYLKSAGAALLKKYACAAALALVYFFLMPFDLRTRQIMVFCVLAPIPSLSPIFAGEMDCDTEVASFIAAASLLVSCVLIPAAAILMGI